MLRVRMHVCGMHIRCLDDIYVFTVSGPGADTDRIHCIWTWIQWIHHVLYLTVSGSRPDTVVIQWIQYVSHRIYHSCREINPEKLAQARRIQPGASVPDLEGWGALKPGKKQLLSVMCERLITEEVNRGRPAPSQCDLPRRFTSGSRTSPTQCG